MSRWAWGLIYWGGVWFTLAFLPAELGAKDIFDLFPWPTLSLTIQHFVQKNWFVAAAVLAAGIGLTVHWLFDQRLWPSLFFGLSVALSAHFLDNKWP